jgi:hypothetical protein
VSFQEALQRFHLAQSGSADIWTSAPSAALAVQHAYSDVPDRGNINDLKNAAGSLMLCTSKNVTTSNFLSDVVGRTLKWAAKKCGNPFDLGKSCRISI